MKILSTVTVAIAIVAVLAGCSGSASPTPTATNTSPSTSASSSASSSASASTASGLEAVCAKGVQEGAVSIWAFTDPDVFTKELQPFIQKYPQIKIDQQSIRPNDAVARVLTDVSAGKAPETDIVQAQPANMVPLVQQNLVDTSIDWTKLGQAQSLVLSGTLRHFRLIRGLGYNTDLVKPSELPKTWDELIDPKWDKQIVVEARGYLFDFLGVAWGEQKLLDYVNRLKSTVHPIVQTGQTTSAVTVGSGQAKLTTNVREAEVNEQKAKGAPIDLVYLDYVPVDDTYLAVIKGAKHPNAAACLVAWMNDPAVLDLLYQNEWKKNLDTPPNLPDGAKIVNATTPDEVAQAAKVGKEVADIWAAK